MSARRRKTRRRGGVGPLTLVLLAVVAWAGWWLWREVGGRPSHDAATSDATSDAATSDAAAAGNTTATVVIPKGSSVRVAADSLQRAGVITSTRLFRWYVSIAGGARTIKPGRYPLAPHTSYADVLDALVAGRGERLTVTIPEGFDVRAIAPLLARVLSVTEDSVRAAVADTAWRRRLDVPVPSLEGYLFPATYTFAHGTTAREAVIAMLERFETAWQPEWNARLQAMDITRHQAMTMASIVEKEARKAEERPIIAAVYWNRLKTGMRLQADPTVQYALPTHVGRVLFKDLEVESRYNTYKYDGLPPGPIASPGAASIVAALTPADVPYLYFVAHPEGHHEFRRTFAEHSRAIVMIKQKQREARRAAQQDSARAANAARANAARKVPSPH